MQDTITQNLTFNATIEVKENTTFPNEKLEIPLQVTITIPDDFKALNATDTSTVIGIVVSLLILIAVVALVWKFKVKNKSKGNLFYKVK